MLYSSIQVASGKFKTVKGGIMNTLLVLQIQFGINGVKTVIFPRIHSLPFVKLKIKQMKLV